MIDQNVGADQPLHHVEDGGMARELVHPGKQQMGLGPELARQLAEGRALFGLERLQAAAIMRDLGRA